LGVLLVPGLEVGELRVRRDVVALARRDLPLGGRAHGEVLEQALRRRLVLGGAPNTVETRQDRIEPTSRPLREAMRPALLGDLGGIALADGPRARRVEDQRALAGEQPLVVRRVVPGRGVRRTERGELLAVLEHLADGVRLDRHVALGVHELRAIGQEQGADPLVGVGGGAERQAEGIAGLLALFGACRKASHVQLASAGGLPAG